MNNPFQNEVLTFVVGWTGKLNPPKEITTSFWRKNCFIKNQNIFHSNLKICCNSNLFNFLFSKL